MSAAAKLHIRHVEPADAAEWVALRRALWPEDPNDSHSTEVKQFFARSHSGPGSMPEAVLLALDETRATAVGFAEVSRRAYAEGCETSPVGFLEGWYVVPEYRRRGIGRALVSAAEEWARELGCREFASDALAENTVSAAAHEALGFEEVEILRCFRKPL